MTNQFEPVSLCEENPHYVMFRGKPTILFTSGEHYSAVLNLAFDNEKYLQTLKKYGFNHTRLYSGIKREIHHFNQISGDQQAPSVENYICPWQRSDIPGALDGGNKFDLDKWDDNYFKRLKRFFKAAGEHGVEIEFTLFSAHHMINTGPRLWEICPMNGNNNINHVGHIENGLEFHSMKHKDVVKYQDIMIKKLVTELNEFDNFHFEICNEPYNDFISDEWQQHVADVIVETEASLKNKHLISVNVYNGFYQIDHPLKHVSIFNFHYISDRTIERNYGLNKVIGMNETGILEKHERYDYQAWEVIFSGGGLYNMLDYSFAPGYEDGTFEIPDTQPGGGDVELCKKLSILNDYIQTFDFVKMRPHNELIKEASLRNGKVFLLAEVGKQYAVYFYSGQHCGRKGRANLGIDMPEGNYAVEVMITDTGEVISSFTENHKGGIFRTEQFVSIISPVNRYYAIAVSIKRI